MATTTTITATTSVIVDESERERVMTFDEMQRSIHRLPRETKVQFLTLIMMLEGREAARRRPNLGTVVLYTDKSEWTLKQMSNFLRSHDK